MVQLVVMNSVLPRLGYGLISLAMEDCQPVSSSPSIGVCLQAHNTSCLSGTISLFCGHLASSAFAAWFPYTGKPAFQKQFIIQNT